MSDELRINRFLKGLEYLSKKYDLYIEGCGCCGSPYIVDNKSGEIISSCIEYDVDEKYYTALGTVENKGFYTSD